MWKSYWACSFEPTYKELKPATPMIITDRSFGFEPTYKELKLGIDICDISKPARVLSLPIRN